MKNIVEQHARETLAEMKSFVEDGVALRYMRGTALIVMDMNSVERKRFHDAKIGYSGESDEYIATTFDKIQEVAAALDWPTVELDMTDSKQVVLRQVHAWAPLLKKVE